MTFYHLLGHLKKKMICKLRGLCDRRESALDGEFVLSRLRKGGFVMDKNQAIGYMIIALKESGITDKETIKTVVRNMAIAIDEYTEEYADSISDEY